MVTIRGHEIDVDITRELQLYDWQRPRLRGDKFLACSPFRSERHPSFAVHLHTGVWIDSGSDDEEWKKGGFSKLLSWLRNETIFETESYLLEEYGIHVKDIDSVQLSFRLPVEESQLPPLSMERLIEYRYRHPYLLEQRGIQERYQRAFQIGYDRKNRAITFPWFDREGALATIKFRSVTHKWFWYVSDGQPVKNHVYGMNLIYQRGASRAYIVESEIDAITLWQIGQPAIALGGAHLSPRQRELILQSPIQELIIATDNDRAGKRIAESIIRQLGGYVCLKTLRLPDDVKDVNELSRDNLKRIAHSVREIDWLSWLYSGHQKPN
ncbi:toprim domain-containing protein [Heliobacillus mobilis]|uniref:Toprim domain-containing protein n=1 Tax=Heliobacterium mobile TaxID=28064 RepID=A0A6I3SM30_HELMO|nr:toprim domain-containing protein [Heliobacterium mobile]MTV49826.1 toprim domain-containing protein [Heliobacterium mobile]